MFAQIYLSRALESLRKLQHTIKNNYSQCHHLNLLYVFLSHDIVVARNVFNFFSVTWLVYNVLNQNSKHGFCV